MRVSEKPKDLVEVGRVFKPRGVKGEVFVVPDREGRYPFTEGATVWLDSGRGATPMLVERFFDHKGRGVLKLGGLLRFEDAQAVIGAALLLPPQEVGEEPEGVFDPEDLLGRAVLDATRGPAGTVTGTRRGPAYWIIDAEGPRGAFEFPAVAGLGVEIPKGERVVRTDLPGPWPGLDEREGDSSGATAAQVAEDDGEG
jgi:16S rRNA processing protein RimM